MQKYDPNITYPNDAYSARCDEISALIEKLKIAEMAVSKANEDHWFMINLIEKFSSDKESCLKDVLERLKFRKPLYESTLLNIKAK